MHTRGGSEGTRIGLSEKLKHNVVIARASAELWNWDDPSDSRGQKDILPSLITLKLIFLNGSLM